MGDGVRPPPPVWPPPPSRLTTASSTGRPQTTASSVRPAPQRRFAVRLACSTRQTCVRRTDAPRTRRVCFLQGRRLREFLPSSHSRQSDASFVSSSTIQVRVRALP
jgi:hypothetical protein